MTTAGEFQGCGGDGPQEELNAYLVRARETFGREPNRMALRLDGDFVDIDYTFGQRPFERIRRITGSLGGTLERFNNAKRSEVHDRVKHRVQAA